MNKVIPLVSACAATVGISYGMYAPLVPVFSQDVLGADFAAIGIIGLANYVPYMFAPILVGLVLDRVNRSYMLATGVLLAAVSVFMLSFANSVPEVLFFRLLAGIAHAFFWPSSEVLIASTAGDKRVTGIAIFTAAWVAGFMVGPLVGKVVLDSFDFWTLFRVAAVVTAAAVVPAILLRRHGTPDQHRAERIRVGSLMQVGREMTKFPSVSAVLIYYAVTFGVILAVYPAYMGGSSLSAQEIEYLFFIFGASRFATLFLVPRIARYGILALAFGVAATAAGMLISFLFTTFLTFAAALALVGLATSIFYPVTFNIVTKNTPSSKMGQKLGVYETMFGIGWAVGPLAVGLSSQSFGSSTPYLALFVIGSGLAMALALAKR